MGALFQGFETSLQVVHGESSSATRLRDVGHEIHLTLRDTVVGEMPLPWGYIAMLHIAQGLQLQAPKLHHQILQAEAFIHLDFVEHRRPRSGECGGKQGRTKILSWAVRTSCFGRFAK